MTPRIHVALAVRDLEASLAFYKELFQCEPAKHEKGYAKLEPSQVALNFTLNETAGDVPGTVGPSHFGIEVGSTEEVVSAHGRMRAAGYATMSEDGVTCCFAVQDKVWIVDPDGHRWEVFVRHSDAAVHSLPAEKVTGSLDLGDCCAEAKAETTEAPSGGCC